MIRVGIMGCAAIAKRSLIPAFVKHESFCVTAIASRTLEKASSLAQEYGCRACSYDDLVSAHDVDLVYCPLPTGLHYIWVKRLLNAGKHVLCEKSLAVNSFDVEDLVCTARANKCFLMESFQFRFHAQNLYVKQLLANGAIGPLRQAVIRFGIPPFQDGKSNIRYSRELGGGALLDNGAYIAKCATYLFGSEVEVCAAMIGGENPELGDVDITGAVMMRAGDLPIQAAYGFDHFYQNSYEIWGRDGKIMTVRAFTAREDFAAPVIVETTNKRDVKIFNDDHFARLLDYISNSIRTGLFETEYAESLIQSRILSSMKQIGCVR